MTQPEPDSVALSRKQSLRTTSSKCCILSDVTSHSMHDATECPSSRLQIYIATGLAKLDSKHWKQHERNADKRSS
jgi:hypothetical protein